MASPVSSFAYSSSLVKRIKLLRTLNALQKLKLEILMQMVPCLEW